MGVFLPRLTTFGGRSQGGVLARVVLLWGPNGWQKQGGIPRAENWDFWTMEWCAVLVNEMPIPPRAILTGAVKILVVGYVRTSDFFCPAHPAEPPDHPRSAVVPCVHVTSVVSGRACLGVVETHPDPLGMCALCFLVRMLGWRKLGLIAWGTAPGSTNEQ